MFNLNLIKMKKGFLLKIVMGAGFLVCLGSNSFGQVKDANLSVDQTVVQYVTVNKAMPYYVQPDAYFNTNYIAPGWTVTSTFAWSFLVDPVSFNISDPAIINPDITIGTVGSYTLEVVETSTDGCADATPTQLVINVLAAPSFDFNSLADILDHCGDQAAMDVTFQIIDNGADAVDGTGDYLIDWTYDVDNLESDKATLNDELAASDVTNTDVAVFTTDGAGKILVNQAFPVLNNEVTRYTFTLTGINDAVSRRSDYIAPLGRNLVGAYTNYAPGADNTFVVMVLPAPTTGPIYHLPNL
jgi:hypothetical protein